MSLHSTLVFEVADSNLGEAPAQLFTSVWLARDAD